MEKKYLTNKTLKKEPIYYFEKTVITTPTNFNKICKETSEKKE